MGTLDAAQAGTTAASMPASRLHATTPASATTGTTFSATMPSLSAVAIHDRRPNAMPSGTPTTSGATDEDKRLDGHCARQLAAHEPEAAEDAKLVASSPAADRQQVYEHAHSGERHHRPKDKGELLAVADRARHQLRRIEALESFALTDPEARLAEAVHELVRRDTVVEVDGQEVRLGGGQEGEEPLERDHATSDRREHPFERWAGPLSRRRGSHVPRSG